MHLLYVDESGAIGNPNDRFFILAGVSVFERHTHWIERDLNEIAERFDKEEPHRVELHGNPMRSGKGIWRRQQPAVREQAIIDALAVGVRDRIHRPRLFAVVLEKANHPGEELAELAFEQLSSRFDMYLRRLYLEKVPLSDPDDLKNAVWRASLVETQIPCRANLVETQIPCGANVVERRLPAG